MTGASSAGVLRRALRAAAPLYVGLGVTYAAALALKALLVGWVLRGPEEMARFETLDRALQWIVTISLLGMPAAVLRLAPERPDRQPELVRTAIGVSIAVCGTAVAAVLFVPGLHELLVGPSSRLPFAVFGLRGVVLPFLVFGAALLHARGQLARRAVLDASDRVLTLVAVTGFAMTVTFRGLLGAALGGALGAALSCLLLYALLPGVFPWGFRRIPRDVRRENLRALVAIGRPQLAMSVLETLRPLVLLRVASEVVGSREAGLLATAAAFSLPLIAIPEMAAQALFPAMVGPDGERAHVEGERRRLLRETLVAGVPLLALYGAAAAWLLPIPKDGQYAAAVPALLALLPGVLAHGLTAHAGYVLLVRGHLRAAALVSALTLVVTALAAGLLLPRYGAVGGAVALSAALCLRAVLLLTIARRA